MTDKSARKQRGSGRPWPKGKSGNPRGRPKGSGQQSQLRAAILEDAPEIIAALALQAKKGDSISARILLDRVLPALRAEVAPVVIEGMGSGSLTERAERALEAAGGGEVSTEAAGALVGALAALARIREADELERRIAALEAKHEETD